MLRLDQQSEHPWAQYRAHGDPFPLNALWLETVAQEAEICFPQRGRWTADALNSLAMHGANSQFLQPKLQGMKPNLPQQLVADRVVEAFREAGPPPDDLNGPQALEEICSCKDLYMEEPSNLAPYDYSKIKVLHSDLKPRDLSTMVPRFVKGILDRYDTMIERSASEISAMGECPYKPYWDPALRQSTKEVHRLMVGLAQKGLVSFHTGIKERIGVFTVRKKTPRWNRLIIDARRVNWSHRPPPTTRLGTPRSLIDVQMSRSDHAAPLAYGLEADVADCFYNYVNPKLASWFGVDTPLRCSQWVKLGWTRAPIFSDATQSYFLPNDDTVLYPVFQGLCMGWAWALFFANEAVAFAVAGRIERPLSEVRDRLPPPTFGETAITGVYVDNISIIGPTKQSVLNAKQKIMERFSQDGIPLTWSAEQPSEVLETIGVVFDFKAGVARNKPRRIWRVFLAGKELLRRRRVSLKVLEAWVGHVTSLFMLHPALLSCFHHIYRFLQNHRAGRAEIWKEVREEIKLSLGVLWLSRCNLEFVPVRQVDAGDSSGKAYALMTTWATFREIAASCRWRESWRFRPLPQQVLDAVKVGDRPELERVLEDLQTISTGPILEQELKPTSSFGAGLSTQYASWLIEARSPSSWLRTSAVASQLKARPSKRTMVEVPALVQPLAEDLCQQARYSLLWRKRWRFGGSSMHINVKEAKVALSSLKRTCRVAGLHGKTKLTLTDNLSALCAFERGRASSYKLNQVCRSAAAYSTACGVRWRLRHIETLRNPADHDSRFTEEQKTPKCAPCLRPPKRPPEYRDCSGTGAPSALPSSSSSARASGTAICGRVDCATEPLQPETGGPQRRGRRNRTGVPTTLPTSSSSAQTFGTAKHGRVGCTPAPLRGLTGADTPKYNVPVPKTGGSSTLTSAREARQLRPGKNPYIPLMSGGGFLEIFSGRGNLTAAIRANGGATYEPIEAKAGPQFDMRRRSTQRTVLAWVRASRFSHVHLGMPCTVFSRARRGVQRHDRALEKERVGLELALFCAEVIHTCMRYNISWSLENPKYSRLFEVPFLTEVLSHPHVLRVDFDLCMYGVAFKRSTTIFTNNHSLSDIGRQCRHRKHEEVLRGSAVGLVKGKKLPIPKTQRAGEYPMELVKVWAQALSTTVGRWSPAHPILDAQWKSELELCLNRHNRLGEPAQASDQWDFHRFRLSKQAQQAHRFIIYGQHTSREAQENEAKLRKILQPAARSISGLVATKAT